MSGRDSQSGNRGSIPLRGAKFTVNYSVNREILLRLIALYERAGHQIEYLESALAAYRQPRHLDLAAVRERFLIDCEARGCRRRTVLAYRETLRRLDGSTRDDVQRLLATPTWGAWARKHHLLNLRAFFAWCVRERLLEASPCDGIRAPRTESRIDVYALDEIRRVVAACRRTDAALLPFYALLQFAGLRWCEAIRIRKEHVHDGYIEVTAGVAKTRSRRLVPIYFSTRTANAVGDVRDARRRIRRIFCVANVPLRRNAMRHTFASMLVSKTQKDPRGIAPPGVLGHSDEVLHRHYRALVAPAVADAFFALAQRI